PWPDYSGQPTSGHGNRIFVVGLMFGFQACTGTYPLPVLLGVPVASQVPLPCACLTTATCGVGGCDPARINTPRSVQLWYLRALCGASAVRGREPLAR